MYDTLYAVPEGTATDFPFLRSREDWRVCQVLGHLANRKIPPEAGDKANLSWDYYPGSPPKLGEMARGVHVPGALGEWTIRTSLRFLKLYEQREVRDVPVVRRKALYPTTPVWWEHVEVPRGMAARVPQMVALQGSQLMGEPLGGPYHLILAALWAVEVADVFLGSIRHHGHLWRLPMAIWSAFADLTPERLCAADPSAQPLLEAGLKLLRLVEEHAPANRLSELGGPRGVFRLPRHWMTRGPWSSRKVRGTPASRMGGTSARIPESVTWTGTWWTRLRLVQALRWLQSPLRPLPLQPPPLSPCALPLGGGCHVGPTCRAWKADLRDLVGPTPLGVAVGRLLLWGDRRAPRWSPLLSLLGMGRPSLVPRPPSTRPYGRVWGVLLGNSRPSSIMGWTILSSWR